MSWYVELEKAQFRANGDEFSQKKNGEFAIRGLHILRKSYSHICLGYTSHISYQYLATVSSTGHVELS